jgi:hypothetical protein
LEYNFDEKSLVAVRADEEPLFWIGITVSKISSDTKTFQLRYMQSEDGMNFKPWRRSTFEVDIRCLIPITIRGEYDEDGCFALDEECREEIVEYIRFASEEEQSSQNSEQ